jgi:hypothetical protein
VKFSREFIELNVLFAHHVERVQGLPLAQALLDYTHLYLAFGLGRDFEPADPVWQAFLTERPAERSLVDWTFEFHRARQARLPPKVAEPGFGCFSYALWPEQRVRLHFHNGETTSQGPLSLARRPQRLAELTALFRDLQQRVPATTTVIGGSWLYNLEAYRRLFPEPYLATAQAGTTEFQFIALWGQFLDRHGAVRPDMAQVLLERSARCAAGDDLNTCFPYRVLRLACELAPFYRYYGLN